MPRNSNGTYQLPIGNPVTSGTVISASWANTTIPDLATAISGTLTIDGTAPMTGPLKISDGVVSYPGITFNGESGTGMYRKGTFSMGLAVNGADALVLSPTGLVVPQNLAVSGNTTVTGTASVTGAVNLANNLSVAGSSSVTGTSTLTGAVSLANNLTVAGTTALTGALTGSSATFSGNVTALTLTGNGAAITNIPNAGLVNKTVTLGSTTVALGASSASINDITLGGTVNGPTLGATTNDTRVATTAMVQTAITYALPRGVIVAWAGAIAAIPAGWALCNGGNGTPNLMDRFIMGAGSGYGVGTIGGNVNPYYETTTNGWHGHGMDVQGGHSHGGATDNTWLTIDQIPSHTHGGPVGGGASQVGVQGFPQQGAYPLALYATTTATGGGGPHLHGIQVDGYHAHNVYGDGNHLHGVTIDTRSPYYALAYIMKL